MLETRIKRCFLTLLLLAASLRGWSASDMAVTAERPAEYMIYQHADTILVLKAEIAEAEFDFRTFGPDNALIKSSAVPGRRIGPVYQYVDAADRPRQLMIEVAPGRPVERSAIGLEILQFNAGDRNSATLARAYRLLSLGCETSQGTGDPVWASKAYSLRNAAAIFADLGMEEMRLWSEYFAAHLVLHRLEDPVTTLELVDEVQNGAGRAGFQQTEFAARVLQSEAVLQLATASGERSAPIYLERAHAALAHVVKLAQRLGLNAEHGRALFQDGRVYELQGQSERALQQYQAALDIVAATDDAELLNQIRATAAEVYESLGRTSGAIAMLDDIADDLAAAREENAADLEIAGRRFEKGRLLNKSYRYSEAVVELSQALELQQENANAWQWGPTGLELAWAYYSMGDPDRALSLLEASLPVTPLQGNTVLLARAYGSLANIHRERREFEQTTRAREQELGLIGDGKGQAAILIEAGLDAWSRDGSGSTQAQQLLQDARRAAVQEDDLPSANRAGLYHCLLWLERRQPRACEASAASYEAQRNSGIPRLAADAALVQSRILLRSGQAREARNLMDQLISDVHWYRRTLPGVLGAWYAENRDELSNEYLSLTRTAPTASSDGAADGGGLLLAMERVRLLEAADYARTGSQPLGVEDTEPLRGLLARREAASGEEAARLASEVKRRLAEVRRMTGADSETVSASDLQRLLAGLGRAEAVLSYYFSGRQTQALLARRGGVQAIDLPGAASVREQLKQLRGAWAGSTTPSLLRQLEALGEVLLGPLARKLPDKVYLLPTGPLRALPLDALRLGGRYFAENHLLVNLTSLASIARRSPSMPTGFQDRVFVAGNPQEQGDPFSLAFTGSPEIAAVTDQFVGPGLHIVQGVALRKDEFEDERFARAALIHLALAGTLDLAFPDRSRLLLAPVGARHTDSSSYLAPGDVRGFDLAAELVVLSGAAVVGEGQSPIDSRLAFVADFLEAGSAAVLVSLWPAGERLNADFATDLYRELREHPDIASALARAKRARIAADPATNLLQWAGFQLFIR